MLKEIAYRWGKKQVLKIFRLVLLVPLHDPTVQQAASVSDLLQNFCEGNRKAMEIAVACHDHLSENGGKDLMFLFDGYDEFHTELREKSLIAKLLQRQFLPNCTLVVSSRPHATAHLRTKATVRIDILGFSEVQRNQFIQQALEEQPQSSKGLIKYLEDHLTISSLCVVPFNMVALLYLYKLGISLPNNSTELYNHFICQTIYRHLAKDHYSLDNTITDLTNLPYPCSKIIQQLSKFSLKALNNNMLVFTLDEIKAACPDIIAIPGAINGFGLLLAIQHFGLTGKTMTFNFVHFSIQEFLAAHHVANLSPSDELRILKEKFWSDFHSNMFAIYIALTKGQKPSFRQFIKPSLGQWIKGLMKGEEVVISKEFLDTYIKCIHLFHCFFEAGDKHICRFIENAKLFNSRIINIDNTRLSLIDLERITVFITCSSHKEWKELNMGRCHIQDRGIHMLHRGLANSNVTIETVKLNWNSLTKSSSFAISDITIKCRVKVLIISGNGTISEDGSLYSIISDPSSVLEELHMNYTKLSSHTAIHLFAALTNNRKLKVLYISNNNITDEACSALIAAMKKNTSLTKLRIYDNPISGECAHLIVQACSITTPYS